jgi:sporulation protein YlmC with PRC-barrel domain
VIDDHNVVLEPAEALRLKPIIELRFELLGKKVISSHFPIGKVADYALDRDTFSIQKLYVEPTAWKKLQSSRLTIDRSQVIEVSQSHVRVKGTEIKEKSSRLKTMPQPSLSSASSAIASLTEE